MSYIFTPDALALSHKKKGTKWKKMLRSTMAPNATTAITIGDEIIISYKY